MKIIVLSCMHGRQNTVKYCLNKMPFIDKIMIYSKDSDGEFLDSTDVFAKAKYKNSPLSFKWNAAMKTLEDVDFDGVILLGSDDYIDKKFLRFAQDNINNYDMIGFKDLYFESNNDMYYWGGYLNRRRGEPSGAGKIYNKSFLERINYNLFNEAREKGLDGLSWRKVKQSNAKTLITSLKENDLFLCDVKDGKGLTSIDRIEGLKLVKN